LVTLGEACTNSIYAYYRIPDNDSHFIFVHSMLEEGGTTLSFGKACERCQLKCVIRVHNPQFYWKVLLQLLSSSRIPSSYTSFILLRYLLLSSSRILMWQTSRLFHPSIRLQQKETLVLHIPTSMVISRLLIKEKAFRIL
jgi:hypothetical protein